MNILDKVLEYFKTLTINDTFPLSELEYRSFLRFYSQNSNFRKEGGKFFQNKPENEFYINIYKNLEKIVEFDIRNLFLSLDQKATFDGYIVKVFGGKYIFKMYYTEERIDLKVSYFDGKPNKRIEQFEEFTEDWLKEKLSTHKDRMKYVFRNPEILVDFQNLKKD